MLAVHPDLGQLKVVQVSNSRNPVDSHGFRLVEVACMQATSTPA
ncbi:hypothetical protein AB0F49_28100 [Micromonospora ureilytica]